MHIKPGTIARKAISVGLGLAIACASGFGTARIALAEPDEASVTITQTNNPNAAYDAYQLFEAEVSDQDEATHVDWASTDVKTIVLGFLDQNGYEDWLEDNHSGKDQHDRPQNALEFICEEIDGSETDDDAATNPATTQGGSFATMLSRHLAKSNATSRRATAGSTFSGTEGYWLFVSSASTTGDPDDAGTAPIWLALGGSHSQIAEKTAVPTVRKEVREDSISNEKDAWGRVADANIGQEVSYRLIGTLPSNFGAYDSYHYRFEDRLSPGLELAVPEGGSVVDALSVTVNGRPATIDGQNLTASLSGQLLTIDFADLKSSTWSGDKLGKDAQIDIEYKARLNASAAIGPLGNDNTVTLVYTNDPVRGGDGRTTPPPSPKLYAYELTLHKVDGQTGEALQGAGFTIQVAQESSDASSRGLYVQEDGSLSATAHEFVTDENGILSVAGIDEGTYTIAETKVPDGFDVIDHPVTVVISSTHDKASAALTGLTATVSGGNDAEASAEFKTALQSSDANTGNVTLDVTNDRVIDMPLTGMAGVGGMTGLGVAAVAGISLWIRRRRLL